MGMQILKPAPPLALQSSRFVITERKLPDPFQQQLFDPAAAILGRWASAHLSTPFAPVSSRQRALKPWIVSVSSLCSSLSLTCRLACTSCLDVSGFGVSGMFLHLHGGYGRTGFAQAEQERQHDLHCAGFVSMVERVARQLLDHRFVHSVRRRG